MSTVPASLIGEKTQSILLEYKIQILITLIIY